MTAFAVLVSAVDSELDPWHDYSATTPRLAAVLKEAGLAVKVRLGADRKLPPIADATLLVIHAGEGLPATEDDAGRAALIAHVAAGKPILAMHAAASAMRGIPEWGEILGGRWINGTSFHPSLGLGHVDIIPGHDVVRNVASFELTDERYADLALDLRRTDVATHEHEHRTHPLVWVRANGASTLVYDALGHDTHSFESPEHRAIIRQASQFLTAPYLAQA